jgi:MFS superfamily sulfate permease-like transporter
MNASTLSPIPATQPTFAELYTPKLVTILREGYGLKDLRADAIAGMTVAIVALPLSMAIAVASGVGPERGLYTAIVGGFLISLLGGSRFQIGGPAGAFGAPPRSFVLDFCNVPLIDITAANALRGFVQKLERSGTRIYFAGARPAVRKTLEATGFREPTIRYAATAGAALELAKTHP